MAAAWEWLMAGATLRHGIEIPPPPKNRGHSPPHSHKQRLRGEGGERKYTHTYSALTRAKEGGGQGHSDHVQIGKRRAVKQQQAGGRTRVSHNVLSMLRHTLQPIKPSPSPAQTHEVTLPLPHCCVGWRSGGEGRGSVIGAIIHECSTHPLPLCLLPSSTHKA